MHLVLINVDPCLGNLESFHNGFVKYLMNKKDQFKHFVVVLSSGSFSFHYDFFRI